MGIARKILRGAPLLASGVLAVTALAYTGDSGRRGAAGRAGRVAFALVASPMAERVLAGGTARYRIKIVRGAYRGKIRLAAVGSSSRLAARLASTSAKAGTSKLTVAGKRAFLTVTTKRRAPRGTYKVRVRGRGGRYRAQLFLRLIVTQPSSVSFTVSGTFGQLWPGSSRAVNLTVTNPHATSISISNLAVSIRSISAPQSSAWLPCSTADFSVRPFRGSYPLKIPAHAAKQLSALGVTPGEAPQMNMLNRPVNQDGCQGATITLSYAGTATSP